MKSSTCSRVDAATAALQSTPAMEKAVTLLQEGEKPNSFQQKNILIMDIGASTGG